VHDDSDIVTEAAYMRDKVLPAMASVREVADKLERIVADDLWPLPKYQEMLLIR
jgi:glutamine synthetase